MSDLCFICQKHLGLVAPPPGGYLYEDAHWKVCHAPATMASLGTLIVESKRHFLDFADMSTDETASYGLLLRRIYSALKQVTDSERVYTLILLEGAAHFHTWLVPRARDAHERGMTLLARDATCDAVDAQALAINLRAILKDTAAGGS